MAQDRLKLNRDEAIEHIERMDHYRRRWTHYLYGVDWGDPSLYDVVINLEHISIPQACRMLATLTRDRCFQFTPECQAKMNDLAVASRVRASLALNPATSNLEVEAESHGGMVVVRGKFLNVDQTEEIQRIALALPGVSGLNIDELTPTIHG